MGCCTSSPHTRRRYRDPADLDEIVIDANEFGTFRNNSNVIPDNIDGLRSTHITPYLATDPNVILYEAELDQGRACRGCRPVWLCCVLPGAWAWFAAQGLSAICRSCTCDQACCWLRKEYSSRSFLRIYPNRIVTNDPFARFPWGYCGCGSWNADHIQTHPFDRGAFGFRRTPSGIIAFLCCMWPVYGGVVSRQRCQCNGPLWNRMFTDCGGWWCDEWPCHMLFCVYHYFGIADPDETAFAASIALQAYFERRVITREDMNKCVEYWRNNISEMGDPEGRKRDVCCEPFCIPCPSCALCYERCTHIGRSIPYGEENQTQELKEVYDKYDELRKKQIEAYRTFHGPVRYSTLCRMCGCRRVFGRRGLIFCTEGCCEPHQGLCERKTGEPAPSFLHRDIDDDNDASKVLMAVLGDPPAGVVYRRWDRDSESGENVVVTYPKKSLDAETEKGEVEIEGAIEIDTEQGGEEKPKES